MESMCLRSWKASSALPFHSNGLVFFISRYRGSAFSPSRLRNWLTEARQPVNFWTSCSQVGLRMRSMALIFSGFASMPRS